MRPPRTPLFVIAGFLSSFVVPAYSQCLLNGTYVSTPTANYSCCQGLVSFNVTSWIVSVNGSQISINASPAGPHMVGTINCQTGAFTATQLLPGGCTETYTLQGQVQSVGSWTGTFTAQFVGADCSCFNGQFGTPCTSQQYSVSGALPPTSVRPGNAPPLLARLEVGPNPLGATTTMRVHLDSRQDTRLVVRDVTGRAVATLVAGTWLEEGDYEFSWDGRTPEGRRAPSGIYFVQLKTNMAERVAKLVVLD
jgi:hypothetical protein